MFCIRACNPAGDRPATWCEYIYDIMGCEWNMPANYAAGTFEQCEGDSGEPMGIYGGLRSFKAMRRPHLRILTRHRRYALPSAR
ncbi:hypothetical protein BDZ89DRAFT_1076131 [Hymenopellis radicata]|nr:hypothetical protein BDZ89DRAFT_1076131 [Hymenopellis radicata]